MATVALIARQPQAPDVAPGPVGPTREDVASAVADAEAALKGESVATAWAALAKTAKERIKRLQQLFNDYQQTELYGQVESKGAGGVTVKQMRDDLVDSVPGLFGKVLDYTVGVADDHLDVEAAKKVLAKQRANLRGNEQIGLDGLDAAIAEVFSEAGAHLAAARLEGNVESLRGVAARLARRESDASLDADDQETIDSLRTATEALTRAQEGLRLAPNELHHGMNEVEATVKSALLKKRTDRLAKEGGRLEVYVATYWGINKAGDAQDQLLETVLYGWTIRGIEHTNEVPGANEALTLLLGDGFTWRNAPLPKTLCHVAFERIEGRPTPMHVNTQRINYDAANMETGRVNAPTSGEFAIPKEVMRTVVFHGMTRDLAGRVPAVADDRPSYPR